ncbi:MAG: NADP-dependent glyceraldehyde-3-phosphate dehydrogenase [Pseudomonadota bacterium]
MNTREKISNFFPSEKQIPAEYQVPYQEQKEFLINGEIRTWNGPAQEVLSPICLNQDGKVTPKILGYYPQLTEKEALEALEAATKAYDHGKGPWPMMSVGDRIYCMADFVAMMKKKRGEVINLLMWEIGKSLEDSAREFDRTVIYIEDTINALKALDRDASRFAIKSQIIAQVRRAPLGVVLCMGPYNYPLNETFTTLIPALIMGNTVIFKPPKLGVLLHRPLLECFKKSFPSGVVNTLYGEGRTVMGPLMKSGQIDALAFIGSSKVADALKSQHPMPHRLRCVLGLEAKNPAIILPDADLETTIKECVLGSLSFNGQRCTALKILFVHQSIEKEFLAKLSLAIEALSFGMPWEKGVFLTPLPGLDKVSYMKALVEDATAQGAKVINPNGGQSNGTFFFPALTFGLKETMRLYKEEQFGPIVAVTTYQDIKEPIDYMIKSNYGQQVALFGSNPSDLAKLIDPLANQVCRVNINSQCQRGPDDYPFTGRKDSAEGTLSVSDALRVFSIRTMVAAKESDLNRDIINDIVRQRRSQFLSTDFIL